MFMQWAGFFDHKAMLPPDKKAPAVFIHACVTRAAGLLCSFRAGREALVEICAEMERHSIISIPIALSSSV